MNAPRTPFELPHPEIDILPRKGSRAAWGWMVGGVLGFAALSIGAGWSVGGGTVSTDDAYVQGNIIQITPQISGTVISIGADDTDFVRAGQPLVRLDPTDGKVALLQAQAQLAQTVREVRTVFGNNVTLSAQIELRDAEVSRATTEVSRLQDDVNRRADLVTSGAIGTEEFDHARAQLRVARDALISAQSAARVARSQLSTNQSLTSATTVESHPNVLRAAAHLRETWIALRRSELPAPVDGYVARRGVQIGQRVQAGASLMTVVPLDSLWVDANFKEDQLSRLRIGQPVRLAADFYGSKIDFHGKVAGLGPGTGAAFALLPAQNATGNWVKVVQRVPVRIALDPKELAENPLRVGLSMTVDVDTTNLSGRALSSAPRNSPMVSTAAFENVELDVDANVREIVMHNAGQADRKSGQRQPRTP